MSTFEERQLIKKKKLEKYLNFLRKKYKEKVEEFEKLKSEGLKSEKPPYLSSFDDYLNVVAQFKVDPKKIKGSFKFKIKWFLLDKLSEIINKLSEIINKEVFKLQGNIIINPEKYYEKTDIILPAEEKNRFYDFHIERKKAFKLYNRLLGRLQDKTFTPVFINDLENLKGIDIVDYKIVSDYNMTTKQKSCSLLIEFKSGKKIRFEPVSFDCDGINNNFNIISNEEGIDVVKKYILKNDNIEIMEIKNE